MITQLLLLAERDGENSDCLRREPFGPWMPGGIILALQRLRRTEDRHSVAAGDFRFGTSEPCHKINSLNLHATPLSSDAALLGRTAAVVRHGGDVADDRHFQADGLERADSRFAAGAGAFDADFDFLEAVPIA